MNRECLEELTSTGSKGNAFMAQERREAHRCGYIGRYIGEGNGNPLQYSCLKHLMDRGSLAGYSPWVTKSQHDLAPELAYSITLVKNCRSSFFCSNFLREIGSQAIIGE